VHLRFRSVFSAFVVWFVLVLSPFAQAAKVIVTISGTVDSGTDGTTFTQSDGTPPGAAKVFGGGANLAGEIFTLTITFNASEGTSNFGSCPDGTVYASNNSGSNELSGPTAVLQIGGGSYSFGVLPVTGITWQVSRSAPTSCNNQYSSAAVGFSESYTGAYGGAAGFGNTTLFLPPTSTSRAAIGARPFL
jgi:hypothetical protein